jgi:Sugar (and other) transporter
MESLFYGADIWHQHHYLLFVQCELHVHDHACQNGALASAAVSSQTCGQSALADAQRPPLLQVFADAGLKSPILGAVLVGVVNILGTVAATAVTDSFGRKPLMVSRFADCMRGVADW